MGIKIRDPVYNESLLHLAREDTLDYMFDNKGTIEKIYGRKSYLAITNRVIVGYGTVRKELSKTVSKKLGIERRIIVISLDEALKEREKR